VILNVTIVLFAGVLCGDG